MIFDSDDFGCDHVISDQCQSHDCRDVLLQFKEANPAFKATLFAIPGEMTQELLNWSSDNKSWIELAYHGFYHSSNYECEKIAYDDFGFNDFSHVWKYFAKGFKAPGWQISDDAFRWLKDHDFWVADQDYNDERRPKDLPVYKIGSESIHTHTWNCVGNGVYELYDELMSKIKAETEFKFVSEVVNA